MNEFKSYHPLVNLMYFLFVIGCACVFMNPVCLVISFVSAFLYYVVLKGKKAFRSLLYSVLLMLAMFVINPLISHEGVTVLMYLPGGNPLTMESVIYGGCAALMIGSVMYFFFCMNEVLTGDKLIYLFGKIIPSVSLVLSMTMRFIPEFLKQFKEVATAQRCLGRDYTKGSIGKRIKVISAIFSAVVSRALENSIETADSMRARGFGAEKRTAFAIYTFQKRDVCALIWIVFSGIYTFCGNIAGGMYFCYFPSVKWGGISLFSISLFAAYAFLCITPVVIEIMEVRKWKVLKSKI